MADGWRDSKRMGTRHRLFRLLAGRILLLAVIVLGSVHAKSEAAGPRIGLLVPGTSESMASQLSGLREGLREQGYVEGTNITIESRFANNQLDRLPGLARELIALPVDVLVTSVTQASLAAKESTKTIPIVMIGVSDPVASDLSPACRVRRERHRTSGMFGRRPANDSSC